MSLGNRVKYVRGDLRIDEFAIIFGAHRNTVSKWERNIIAPGADFFLRIYEKFNINLNWLFSGQGETHRPENK